MQYGSPMQMAGTQVLEPFSLPCRVCIDRKLESGAGNWTQVLWSRTQQLHSWAKCLLPNYPIIIGCLGCFQSFTIKISFVISCCILPFSYFCHFNSRKDSYKLRDQWTVVNALLVNIATSLPQGCASCIPPGVDFPQPYKLSVSHNIWIFFNNLGRNTSVWFNHFSCELSKFS